MKRIKKSDLCDNSKKLQKIYKQRNSEIFLYHIMNCLVAHLAMKPDNLCVLATQHAGSEEKLLILSLFIIRRILKFFFGF